MAKYYTKISDEDGNEFLLAVNITGHGAPTEDTEAEPGMCYLDEDSEHGDLYKCIGVLVTETRTVYRWKQLAGQEEVERLEKAIEDTVKTTAQEFTEEQQNQARANIGVYHDMYGLLEISVSGYEGKEIETGISFVEGQEVTVFVDGVENKYTVQSATFEENDEVYTSIYVGDNPFDESGDNGFFIESLSDGMILIVNRTDEMHIYGIYANQSIKIPKKYMPIDCNFYMGSQLPFDYSLYKDHRADGFMVYMVSDWDAQEKFKQYEFMLSQQGIYVREDSDNRTWCDYMTIDFTQNIGVTIKKNENTVFITSHDGYLSFCESCGVTPIE